MGRVEILKIDKINMLIQNTLNIFKKLIKMIFNYVGKINAQE